MIRRCDRKRVITGRGRLSPFSGFVLGDACFDYFFQERGGERLVCWKSDGSFGQVVGFEFVLEELHDGRISHEQAAVGVERGESDEKSLVLEHGDHVADGLCGVWWHHGADGGAKGVQCAAGGFGDVGEVFVDFV